jgi:hypothetical protein
MPGFSVDANWQIQRHRGRFNINIAIRAVFVSKVVNVEAGFDGAQCREP